MALKQIIIGSGAASGHDVWLMAWGSTRPQSRRHVIIGSGLPTQGDLFNLAWSADAALHRVEVGNTDDYDTATLYRVPHSYWTPTKIIARMEEMGTGRLISDLLGSGTLYLYVTAPAGTSDAFAFTLSVEEEEEVAVVVTLGAVTNRRTIYGQGAAVHRWTRAGVGNGQG